MRQLTVRNLTRSNVVGTGILLAETALSRAVGLLGRQSVQPGDGMLITPCSGVHTIGMRCAIDVVGLDHRLRVIRLWPHLVPYRITAISLKVKSVLELAAGEIAATRLRLGDCLELDHSISPAKLSIPPRPQNDQVNRAPIV